MAVDAFLRALEGHNKSPQTQKAYGTDLHQFTSWLEANTYAPAPAQVERADLTEYLAHLGQQGLTGVSRARKLAALREFFKFLEQHDHIPRSPAAGVETPKKEKVVRVWLRPEEYRAMLAQAGGNPRNYCILQLFLQTGVRVSELCDLRLEDIDLQGRTVTVRGKGQKERVIELERKGLEALKNYLKSRPTSLDDHLLLNKDGGPLSERMVRKLVAKYRTRAGIHKQASCHSLRRTFATYKAARGVSPFQLKEWLGHESLATTQLYVQDARQDARRVMEATSL
jgi:site-specific recombinase XerD